MSTTDGVDIYLYGCFSLLALECDGCPCVCVCVYVCICACGIKSETKKGLGDIGGILKQRGLGTLCQLYVVWNNS